MSPTPPSYGLADLARAAGVTPRTVRYYVAQGLLPAPIGAGRGPHYDADHLARLWLIRDLQERHLPLAEIRRQLASMSATEVAEASSLARTAASAQADQPGSALEYVRNVLGSTGRSSIAPTIQPTAAALQAPRPPTPPRPATRSAGPFDRLLETLPGRDRRTRGLEPATRGPMATRSMPSPRAAWPSEPHVDEAAIAPAADSVATDPPALQRSQWDRIALSPDVELHVRRPLSRLDGKRVERLIATARQILKGGS